MSLCGCVMKVIPFHLVGRVEFVIVWLCDESNSLSSCREGRVCHRVAVMVPVEDWVTLHVAFIGFLVEVT